MKLYDNKENGMLDQAIDALRHTTGLTVVVEKLQVNGFINQVDAFIKITINKKIYGYAVVVKNVDRFATVAQVKHQLEGVNERPLLIARRLTDAAADKCKELGLNYIDLAGNAFINEPDFLILIKGQKQVVYPNNPMNLNAGIKAGTATNLRMVFALLCNPEMLNAPYREIQKVAGIALGAVGWVFLDLEARGLTLGGKLKGNRVLIKPEKLTQEWVTNYPIKLRPKLNPQRFRTNNQDWWKNLDVRNYNAQWGGEVAADKLTHYLKPNFFTLYIHVKDARKNFAELIVDNRLIPDPKGNIEVLEAFWGFDDAEFLPEIVPTLLVYADLVASNDPRNLETAKIIYDRVIQHENN